MQPDTHMADNALEHADTILEFLQRHQDDAVSLLKRLVSHESPSREPDTHLSAFDLLRGELSDLGFNSRFISDKQGHRHLFARPTVRVRSRPFQLLLGHVDTVWPLGTLDKMPLEHEKDRITGPGAYDMKAGLVQAIFAIRAIRELVGEPKVVPVFFINSDEEIGSHGSRLTIERLAARACRAFVMEPSLGTEGHLKTARKGVGRYTLRIRGKAAHAGLDPEGGASAILELSHLIQQLFALNDPASGVTVNVGVVDGGLQPNVIAPESTAQVDVRVPTRQDADRIHMAIHGLEATTPGISLKVEGQIGRPPMEPNDESRRLWEKAKVAADSLGFPLDQGAAGGGSDGNFTSQFTPTLDGLGAVGDGAHAHHEHVLISHMSQRSALLALLILAEPGNRKNHRRGK